MEPEGDGDPLGTATLRGEGPGGGRGGETANLVWNTIDFYNVQPLFYLICRRQSTNATAKTDELLL